MAGKSLDLRTRFFLDVRKADDDVGHLHSGVVDVVLNVDFPARRPEQSDKGIAEDRIAQMTDVRGLVGIDARMLHQNLAGSDLGGRFLIGGQRSRHPTSVNLDVEVAGRRDLHVRNAVDRPNFSADRFRNLQRGRSEGLGVRKNGNRKVPEFDLRRLFDDHAGQGDAGVLALQTFQHAQGKAMFEMTIQEVPLSC